MVRYDTGTNPKAARRKKVWVSLEQNVATGHRRSTISYCSFIFCQYKNVSMHVVRWHSPHRNHSISGPSLPWSYGNWIFNYPCNQCISPLMLWVRISTRARCTTLCDQVCQWLTTGRWFSPGTPVSSTNKTDHHDTTETSNK